ncbi:MAG: hypothetical protein HUK17_01595 [Bacteroidales bacterium]|nr:hypothetical protein [Bacteroidales bacterium]
MNIKKTALLLGIAVALVSGFYGCGKDSDNENNTDNQESVVSVPKSADVYDECALWAPMRPDFTFNWDECTHYRGNYPGWARDYICCAFYFSDECLALDSLIEGYESGFPALVIDGAGHNTPGFIHFLEASLESGIMTLAADCPILDSAIAATLKRDHLYAGDYPIEKLENKYYITIK